MPNLLIESTPTMLELVEENTATGKHLYARGIFGRCDVATQNHRVYPRSIMEREIKRLQEDIKFRRLLGELDHPADGKTSLKRVSHVVTKLSIEKNGDIMGEAEVLNTTEGRQLKALIEAKVQIGSSSRGFGTTTQGEMGDMVGEDYTLKVFDFVADPSVKAAYPAFMTESVQPPMSPLEMFRSEFPDESKSLEESFHQDAVAKAQASVKEAVDKAVAESEAKIRTELTETFERGLAAKLLEAREDVGKQLREEFEADPGVAGSKVALLQIAEIVSEYRTNPDEATMKDALKAKDLDLAKMESERDIASAKANEVALELHMEKRLSGHKMASMVRTLIGRTKCESKEDLDKVIDTILEDVSRVPEPEVEEVVPVEVAVLRETKAQLEGKVSHLQEEVDTLKARMKKAVELGEQVDARRQDAEARAKKLEEDLATATKSLSEAKLEVYKRDAVEGLANGRALLAIMEDVESTEAVDRLVAVKGAKDVADGDLRQARNAVRRGVEAAATPLNEDRAGHSRSEVTEVLGTEMDTIMALAGVGK